MLPCELISICYQEKPSDFMKGTVMIIKERERVLL